MRKLLLALILIASLFACTDSVQNSDKQKDMTQRGSPVDSTTATDQQNYGAGNQTSKPKTEQDPSHTENLTNPDPSTPTPQAGIEKANPKKQSGAENNPK